MSSPAAIVDLIEAFRRSKTMFVAVRLGVFDELDRGAQTAAELNDVLKVNADALKRLLDACVGLKLIEREGDRYRNSQSASDYLVSSAAGTLAGYIRYSDQSLYPLWGHLEDAVREGTNRWEQTFGGSDALFAHYFRDLDATRSFLGGMHGFGQLSSPRVIEAFDLSGFEHLVDLGGATGHLAIAACERYPTLRATVLDLEKVQPVALEYIRASPVSDRVEFAAGDFFLDALPRADLFVLGRIVHDWGAEKIRTLLEKIHAALPTRGALLIAETVLNERKDGPVFSLMQDLNMLVCTEGRERTAAEYRELLESVGFDHCEFRRTGSVLDAVLASKTK
jgi:acetylserotonin N-methyltransferase